MRSSRAAIDAIACLSLILGASRLCAQDEQVVKEFDSLIKAEKFAEARSQLAAYTAVHRQSWQTLYQLGYVDFRLHRIQESVTELCASLVLNSTFAESHKILAYDLNILGRQDLAIHELELAIAEDPASAESHYELGRIYFERGSYLQAIQSLEKAKSLAPKFIRVYHNLGLAYSAVAENGKAVANFEQAIQMNAQQSKPSAWPLIDYATYCNSQNDFERARDMLLHAISIDGEWDQEFAELAKSYRALGQTADAIQALKQAIAINPRKADYHYALARLYTQAHELAEAKQQLAEFKQETAEARTGH